nr:polyketide synthase 2 [Chaetomium globosum]
MSKIDDTAESTIAPRASKDAALPEASPPPLERQASDELVLKREPIARWRLVIILVSIGVGLFLSLMDTTIVATMLASISDEFGGFKLAPWVLLSYTLSYLGCTVLIARLSDVLGRKPVLLGCFFIFVLASVACGAASTLDQLIGFRAAQGAGGAGLYAMTMIIYPEISPPELVPLLSALLGIIVALAGVSGPVIGGLLATYSDWRWAFWMNGPIGVVPGLALFFVWPKTFRTFKTVPFRHLDFLGALLLLMATVLLVFIINQTTVREYEWSSPQTIAVLILSGAAWLTLAWWQWYLSRRPSLGHIRAQIPWRILSDRVLMSSIVSTILTGFVMYLVIVNIPMRAQIVNFYNEVRSGVLLLPLMGATAVGSALGGAFSSKQNRTFWSLNAASAFMLLGCGIMSTLPDTVDVAAKQWGFEAILGFGIGLNLSTATLIPSLNADFQDYAIAQGLVAQMRVLGGSLGVAASFLVLNSRIAQTLTGVLSAEELEAFYRSPTVMRSFAAYKQLQVRTTYIEAFQADMYMCIAMSAACLIASLCVYQSRPPSIKKRLDDLEAIYARTAANNEEGNLSLRMENDKQKPIAIVGMSFRFPGDANSTEGFWDILSHARSTRTRIPNTRFNPDGVYHPNADRPGAVIAKEGCFLKEDVGLFDAPFFGITASEAEGMDPQHRLLLEISYEAFENAGIPITNVAGADVGCYVGGFSSDYLNVSGADINRHFDSQANGYGRGEGMGVVIVKPLADAIRDNDVIRAVIRGSGINQDGKTPAITVPNAHAQMSLIRSTYAKAGLDMSQTTYFEAHGTGTPVGDPLELLAIGQTIGAARGEGDEPVLVGSVKSNIGHLEGSSGIAGVIKTVLALERAEIPAVAEFKELNPRIKQDEWNIRIPTELTPWPASASGLRRASINSFGYGGTNGHVILDDALNYLQERGLTGNHDTVVASANQPGTPSSQSSDSAISLAHTIPETESCTPEFRLFAFSSPEQDGLARLAEAYSQYLDQDALSRDLKGAATLEEIKQVDNLAYTLASRRTVFDWRGFAISDTLTGLQTSLKSGLPTHGRVGRNPSCAFVFTGQGAQWFAMGRELLRHSVFRASIDEAEAYITSLGCPWSVTEELNRDATTSRINDPELSQALCTALQVALVDLLAHWGVRPKAVVGHSSGEIGAAYAAGILSREDAWKAAYWRGVRSTQIKTLSPDRKGAMMAAAMSEEAAREYLAKVEEGDVVIACINSPNSVTISGDDHAVSAVEKLLTADNIWCRRLLVKTAYHSPHMEAIADLYRKDIADVRPLEGPSDISVFSSVTGSEISKEEMGSADYWVKNLVSPVRFSAAVTSLLKPRDTRDRRKGVANVQALLELGPHSALQGPLREILIAANETYVASVPYTAMLRRGTSALLTALTAAGRLWSSGFDLNLELVNSTDKEPLKGRPLTTLPRYPFNHKRRYWNESRGARWVQSHPTPRTDLLGQKTSEYSTISPSWKNYLCPSEVPWLLDHKVHGLLVMPGAVYIAMTMEACRDTADPNKTLEGFEFRDIVWHKPIIFESPDAHVEISLQLSPYKIGTKAATTTWTRFSISTIDANNKTSEHCSGLVERKYVTLPGQIEKGMEAVAEWDGHRAEYEAMQARPTVTLPVHNMYDRLNRNGLQFGATFRNLTHVRSGDGFMYGELETPDTAATMPDEFEYPLPLHPTVLDSAFQMLAGVGQSQTWDVVMLPNSIDSLYISATAPTAAGSVLKGYCTLVPEGAARATGTSVLSDEAWEKPVIVMNNLTVTAAIGPQTGPTKTAFARLDWKLDVSHSRFPVDLHKNSHLSNESSVVEAQLSDKTAIEFIKQALQDLGRAESDNMEGKAEKKPEAVQNYLAWMGSVSGDPTVLGGVENQPATTVPGTGTRHAIEAVGAEMGRILGIGSMLETKSNILSSAFLADFANRSLGRPFANSVIANIMDHVGSINPNIEILEIASSSDTTGAAEVLELLGGKGSRLGRYIWTSPDEESVEAASKDLKPNECLQIRTLNIEADVQGQGLSPGTLDYIILDDLLLTTSNLDAALKNIKTLLKPDGRLIVQAITKSQLRTAFVLGSSHAWWRDGQSGERLDEAGWGQRLKSNGFTGVDQIFRDSDDPRVHQLSVMVCSVARETAYEYKDVLLVTPPAPSEKVTVLAEYCSARLAEAGLDAVTLPWPEVADVSGKLLVSLIELDSPVFLDLTEDLFHATKNMSLKAGGVLWMTQAGNVSGASVPAGNVSSGLFRVVRSEDGARPLATLDLSTGMDLASTQAGATVMSLFASLFGNGDIRASDKEFAEDEGSIYVPRLVEDAALTGAQTATGATAQPVMDSLFQPDRKLVMTIGQVGAPDSLRFEDSEKCAAPLPHNHVEVKVLYTGLNFLDIMGSLGEIPRPYFGSEVVGTVVDMGSSVASESDIKLGDTVVGSCNGGFGSHARMKWTMCHRVPDNISIQEAATIPIAFSTAWVSLVDLARMRKGETILIHSAAGGVGQAAIQLCQHFGVKVYATVGSIAKKELLMHRYGIPEEDIFYSRDTTFAQGIRRATNGRGVDLVLNSVAGEFLRQSWHLVAPFGRFVEIGKRDILGNTGLDMEPFIRSASFIGFNLEKYDEQLPEFEIVEKAFKQVFELVAAGRLRPVGPVNVYNYSEVATAFRALQSGKVLGKVVMRANPDQLVPVIPRAKHPLTLNPDATYLLAGGLGGIGRSLATMLHSHGARNLAFISRSGGQSEIAADFLKGLRSLGCTANAYACDISDREHLSRAIEQCQSEMPPIRGSIQCAMTLKDAIFENMTYDDWVSCTRPKIQGSWNLHNVLPQDLDFFIMLASTSGIIGNPGQANYAAGNTFEDALAHYRRRRGQKAMALDIGAVRDVGYLAEASHQGLWSLSHLNALSVGEADIHFLVKNAITGYTIGKEETGPQIVAGLAGATIDEQLIDRSPWARDGKLCMALKASLIKKTAGMQAGIDALARADTAAAAVAVVEEILVRRIAVAVMIPEDEIAIEESLQSYGVNSLVAVEIKTWLAKELQSEISAGEISPSSISALAATVVSTSKLLRGKFKETTKETTVP